MPTDGHGEPDQVLAVNVNRRWSEIEAGMSTEADVVLGDWSPWVGRSTTIRHFDPDRIAVIIACRRGETKAVYEIVPDGRGQRYHWTGDGPRRRLVFHGRPSARYAAQLGAPAPTWTQGEGTPLKLLALDDLLQGEQPEGQDESEQRQAVVGQAVITLSGTQNLTVSIPPHYSVTITPRAAQDRSS
ncbi:hypothetical protein [Streptomyces prunicolor]|uniref:hypothetical protein n=1 Tax=Streptomyces prunicolor TaxID=67348 RepID=UPI0003719901|nr:hypothetical protein [Streptomyces prunicolor]